MNGASVDLAQSPVWTVVCGQIVCVRIIRAHALRLISRIAESVSRCRYSDRYQGRLRHINDGANAP